MIVYNALTGQQGTIDFGPKVCIVGNSGILLGKGNGSEIDSFSGKIIRMNSAVIRGGGGGFVKDVGSRCDIRIVAYDALGKEVFKRRHELGLGKGGSVLLWGSLQHKRGGVQYVKQMAKEFPLVSFLDVGQAVLSNCDQMFTKFSGVPRMASGAWLSTGWVTLCLLLGSGCEVDVYGMFGGGRNLYHYWNAGRGQEGNHYKESQLGRKGHRFLTEHKIFKDVWTKMYKLRFVV